MFETENISIGGVRVYGLNESMAASGYPMKTSGMSVDDECDMERAESRASKLAATAIGTGHDNFLNGIVVQFDLTAPVQMWPEIQRYHFIDFVSSGSKMHGLVKDELTDESFDPRVFESVKQKVRDLQKEYAADPSEELFLELLMNCPLGYKLTARMTTNYRQLKTIYSQRKNHRLPHWKDFCRWIESLDFLGEVLKNEVQTV
jgi:hypothetical protein